MGVFSILSGCSQDHPITESKLNVAAVNYPVFYPKLSSIQPTQQYFGRIQGMESFDKALFAPARVVKVYVTEGQQVKLGQHLMTLYSPFLVEQRQASQMELASARAHWQLQDKERIRLNTLYAKGLVTQQALDANHRDWDVALQRVVQAEAKVTKALNELAETEVIAEHDGVITRLYLRAGSFAPANTPLLRFESTAVQIVRFQVPEATALQLEIGALAGLKFGENDETLTAELVERAIPAPLGPALYTLTMRLQHSIASHLGRIVSLHLPLYQQPLYEVDYAGLHYTAKGEAYLLINRQPVEKIIVKVHGFTERAILVSGPLHETMPIIAQIMAKLKLNLSELN
ncbi:efflux RND transporter periplasmic adaptor subunit [Pseudoalteromonas fenneropenaei]|uniref:Efflux RND transporter periplasmic adaptor subunit n=1 Tax=Pseudoalteromonas fenneropenaei TaxID=1737459 RepID=A0ABV7CHB9_9GAMM